MLTAEETQDKERPLREAVRDTLRTRIFEGHYAPGTRLVERDLAAEFNVSRLPVREALRMLPQEGLISDRGARGAEVSTLSPKDVEDLFDVRQSLEVLACRLAAARATREDLARLEGLLDEADRCLAKGAVMEAHRANSEFHDAITAIADNNFLKSALEPLQGRMHWLFRHVSDLPELIQEHRELYAAIASGDPTAPPPSRRRTSASTASSSPRTSGKPNQPCTGRNHETARHQPQHQRRRHRPHRVGGPALRAPGTELVVRTAGHGVEYIETRFESLIAAGAVAEIIAEYTGRVDSAAADGLPASANARRRAWWPPSATPACRP